MKRTLALSIVLAAALGTVSCSTENLNDQAPEAAATASETQKPFINNEPAPDTFPSLFPTDQDVEDVPTEMPEPTVTPTPATETRIVPLGKVKSEEDKGNKSKSAADKQDKILTGYSKDVNGAASFLQMFLATAQEEAAELPRNVDGSLAWDKNKAKEYFTKTTVFLDNKTFEQHEVSDVLSGFSEGIYSQAAVIESPVIVDPTGVKLEGNTVTFSENTLFYINEEGVDQYITDAKGGDSYTLKYSDGHWTITDIDLSKADENL